MANRIPLIVDTGDQNKIKELPIGDNLNLTGSGIVGVSSFATTTLTASTSVITSLTTNNLTVNLSANLGNVNNISITGGSDGQVLTTDGEGTVSWSTLGNYNQSLNTTDNVQFNTVKARDLEAPINVAARIKTSSTGSGSKIWEFGSTGILTLPVGGDIRDNSGNSIIGYNSIGSDILPDTNNARDIGSTIKKWAEGHFTTVYGTLSGNVIGNVTGTLTGYHEGDMTGSVFGNDSVMLIDGSNSKIVGPIETNISNMNITGGAEGEVLTIDDSGNNVWGHAQDLIKLPAGFDDPQGSISFGTGGGLGIGWQIATQPSPSEMLPTATWTFEKSGNLRLPALGDIVDTTAPTVSLLRGDIGLVDVVPPAYADLPFTASNTWDLTTVVIDQETYLALQAQYPAWTAGSAIPNDLLNGDGDVMTSPTFTVSVDGGGIINIKVATPGVKQTATATDNLIGFLTGDGLGDAVTLPWSGILGRISNLPNNFQSSGLTIKEGQLIVSGITGPTIPVAKFYGDVMISGDVMDIYGESILGGGGGPGATDLDGLTDVVISGASTGQILKYNGTNWVNAITPVSTFKSIAVSGQPGGTNVVADELEDTLTLIEGTGIQITPNATADSITITNTAPNVTQNVFTTITVAGQNNVVADTSTDTLTLVAGTNVTITTDNTADSITINSAQPNTFSNVAVTGQSTVVADNTGDTLTFTAGSGISIATDTGTDTITISATAVSGLESRSTAAGTTSSLSNGASADLNITGFKGYALYKIQTSVAAWIRLYTDAASRTADASRLETVDPTAGSGVIAEVITTGNQTILMSPAVMGFNNETSPTTTIPVRVTNKSGSTTAVTVTLTLLKLEV